VKIPLDGVRRIDVVQHQESRWLQGIGIGAGTGAFLGFYIGARVYDYEPNPWVPNLGPIYGLAIGAPVGMILGAIIGSFVKHEEWEEVPLDQLRVSFAPQRERFTFGVRLVF
jgi:hypothetical protein